MYSSEDVPFPMWSNIGEQSHKANNEFSLYMENLTMNFVFFRKYFDKFYMNVLLYTIGFIIR